MWNSGLPACKSLLYWQLSPQLSQVSFSVPFHDGIFQDGFRINESSAICPGGSII